MTPKKKYFIFSHQTSDWVLLPTLTHGKGLSVRVENIQSLAFKRVLFYVHIPLSPAGFSALEGRGQYLSPTSIWSVVGSQRKEVGAQRAGHGS